MAQCGCAGAKRAWLWNRSVHTQPHHVTQLTLGLEAGVGGRGRGARAADDLRLLREAIRTQGFSSWDSSPNLSQVGEIQFLGRDSNPLKQLRTQERVNVEPYSDFNHWLRALSVRVLGRGFRGRLQTAQGPSLAPRPPHRFTSGLRPHPHLDGDIFLGLEEERIRASWLPHSLQLPGFLIDGDYYVIDLLDRTVPTLGTLCPLPKRAPRPGTSSPESAVQLCRRPQHHLRPGAGDPWATFPGGPGATSWDGAGASWQSGGRPVGLSVGLRSLALPAPRQEYGTHLAPPT